MGELEKVIRAIRFRMRLFHLADAFFWGLTVGLAAAVVLVLALKLFPHSWDSAILAGIVVGAAVLVALAGAAIRRLTLLEASILADTRLNLRERLSSTVALAMMGRTDSVAFEALARDAREFAVRIRPARDLPYRFPPQARYAIIPAFLLAAAFFVPQLDLLRNPLDPPPPPILIPALAEDVRQDTAERLRQLAEQAREKRDQDAGRFDLELSERLDRLAEELALGRTDARDVVAEMSVMQDELRVRQTSLQREMQPYRQLRGLNVARHTQELQRALKDQDFAMAARELQRMANEMMDPNSGNPQEKEELAQELEALADSLRDSPAVSEALRQAAEAVRQAAAEQRQQQAQAPPPPPPPTPTPTPTPVPTPSPTQTSTPPPTPTPEAGQGTAEQQDASNGQSQEGQEESGSSSDASTSDSGAQSGQGQQEQSQGGSSAESQQGGGQQQGQQANDGMSPDGSPQQGGESAGQQQSGQKQSGQGQQPNQQGGQGEQSGSQQAGGAGEQATPGGQRGGQSGQQPGANQEGSSMGQQQAGGGSQSQGQAGQQASAALQNAAQQMSNMQSAAQQMQQLAEMQNRLGQAQQGMAGGGQGMNRDGAPGSGMQGEFQEGDPSGMGEGSGGPGRGQGGEPPDDGSLATGFEDVFIPGEQNEGEIIAIFEIDAPVARGESRLDYSRVPAEVRQRAADSINNTEIPAGMRGSVRQYFESINLPTEPR